MKNAKYEYTKSSNICIRRRDKQAAPQGIRRGCYSFPIIPVDKNTITLTSVSGNPCQI